MRVETYKREDGLWDWRLIADNGEQVAESHQGYTERNDALEGFSRVRDMILETRGVGVEETS